MTEALLSNVPSPDRVCSALRQQIVRFRFSLRPVSVGTVTEVGDGIARISGLHDIMVGEMVEFEDETLGMALNLEAESVGVIVLGSDERIHEGSTVRSLGQIAAVPVGDELLGRVVDALGRPLDRKGPLHTNRTRPVERAAPGIIERQPIRVPLHTGIKAVDALVPIGRGQRELIIGDRQTGKTTLAVDAILNQTADDVLCIYVAIGQKLASVAQVVHVLERHGVLERTVVVVADAGVPAALQYLAPYAGCAIGEEFMEHGRDVLIVYDDLTKHAWAYRQISLLLRRPPGREAFPGDIFYLHARLLERAGRLGEAYGGGSMTALPIIETQMGDLAAYIPTNVISITDGQIFLEQDLFHAGVRPAINVGLSVSRVAGAAQTPAMRTVAGRLRLEMAQYRELATFAQFGTELDRNTRAALDRGARILEVLKQDRHHPVSIEEQIALFFAVTQGFLDDIPIERISEFERQFSAFLQERQGLRNAIAIQQELTPELEALLSESIHEFKESYLTLDA
ncbi:MAG: F0F1 ATP synthase subunit alpha [Chloroflexi bacterium]|nr:F0F1 ATP synthase subunit alpha [Chloroflexota bacterium]